MVGQLPTGSWWESCVEAADGLVAHAVTGCADVCGWLIAALDGSGCLLAVGCVHQAVGGMDIERQGAAGGTAGGTSKKNQVGCEKGSRWGGRRDEGGGVAVNGQLTGRR